MNRDAFSKGTICTLKTWRFTFIRYKLLKVFTKPPTDVVGSERNYES